MRMPSLLALALVAAAPRVHAQAVDGLLDTSFGGGGQNVVAFDRGVSNKDYARAIVVDTLGRSYLVGDVDTTNGRKIGIVRLLADGAADDTYGTEFSGRVVAPAGGQTSISVTSAVLDAQGYLLVAGSSVVSGTDTSFLVCRFDPQGNLANFAGGQAACSFPDFNIGGFHTDVANSILVQPDGRIVLAGYASSDTGTTLALARLQSNGALDPGFGNGGKTTYTGAPFVSFDATRARLNPDGSLVTAGSAYDVSALHFGVIVHVGADGLVDTAFSGPGYARSPSSGTGYTDVAWDPQWKEYVVIGNYTTSQGVRGYTACLLPGGNAVVCPHGDNSGYYDLGYDVTFDSLLRQADGRWLVAGSYRPIENGSSDLFVARLDPSLALDTTEFAAPQGYAVHDFGLPGHQDLGTAFALQGGRILVAGAALRTANTSNYDFAVASFALDRIFQTGIEKP
jgi:uncharacterized delta-60 repeat protein